MSTAGSSGVPTRVTEEDSVELDYSTSAGDGVPSLARDRLFLRSLREDDRDAIVKIDRRITSRDRCAYLDRKLSEALYESGIRLSLVAEVDGQVAGFIMARVDYGEFGQTDTTAIIDTLGVDPEHRGEHIGTALMSQLLGNLTSLRVDVVRTEVAWRDVELNRFLSQCGFRPAQQLVLAKPID